MSTLLLSRGNKSDIRLAERSHVISDSPTPPPDKPRPLWPRPIDAPNSQTWNVTENTLKTISVTGNRKQMVIKHNLGCKIHVAFILVFGATSLVSLQKFISVFGPGWFLSLVLTVFQLLRCSAWETVPTRQGPFFQCSIQTRFKHRTHGRLFKMFI